jgi:plastocyanin/mono/diheme cytochrome c family protein
MIDPGQAVVGIIVLLIAVGGLLYLFYSRTNAVEKTGYGALIMLAIVSLMIPVFWILESNGEAMAKAEQHKIAVQRGATLYAQYCFQCHGTRGQGRVGPKLNGNPAVNKLSDADLLRIINGGIYNTDVTQLDKPVMPAWSQDYGGPLTNNDIQYLFELIRSSDPDYLAKNGYQGDSAINGFTLVEALEQANSANAYATAKAQESSGAFGAPTDMTKKNAVTINIVAPPPNATCAPACFEILNVKVKVGTKITWDNKDPVAHTVTALQGTNVETPVPAKNIFDSGNLPSGATFEYTVSMAAYNFNPNHTVIYYCQYHPSMLAELTIVP